MPKHVLGIEFGVQHIAAVQITGTPKAYTITAAAEQTFPHHPDPGEQGALQRQVLQDLIQTQQLRGDTIITTLPAHHAVLRNLTLPFKDPRRIRQVIKFELDEHMPFDPDDVVVDFHMLPTEDKRQTPLLVAAMPQQVVADHLALLQEAGLEPAIIDLDLFALANAALLGMQAGQSNTVLVDLQAARTLITMLHNGSPVFARSLAHTGSLVADPARLSKYLQHTIYAGENALQQSCEPEVFVISGEEGEQLERLAGDLYDELGVPAEVWRLSSTSYKPGSDRLAAVESARYAVAFGAAARGMYRQAIGMNWRRDRFALHRNIQELRGRLIGLGVMLVCVAGLGLFSLYLQTRYKTRNYAQLQGEIARLFQTTLPEARMVQPVFQMREKIRAIDDRLRAFGGVTGAQLSGMQILREISARVPTAVTVNVDNLTITTETTDLSGTTTSYDDVVKLKDALEASPFFSSVKINTTKADVANRVAFKLTITTAKTPEKTA